MTVHLVEDHPTHFKLSNGAVIPKNAQTLCAGGIYDFVTKQAKMAANGGMPGGPYAGLAEAAAEANPEAADSPLRPNVPLFTGMAAGTAPDQYLPGHGPDETDVGAPTVQPAQPMQPTQPQQPAIPDVSTTDTDSTRQPDPRTAASANTAQDIPGYLGQLSTTKTEHVINDPKQLKIHQEAADQEQGLVKDQANIDAGQLAAEADKARAQQGIHDEQAQIIEQHAQARQKFSDDYQANVTKLINQYAKQNIKPKSIYETDNLGQNISAGLAIGLGALGGAFTGSNQNVGLDIINKAIDRDLEAQKINLEKIPTQVNMLGVAYKAARDAGMDDQEAHLAAKGKALESIADQYTAIAKTSQSAMVQSKAASEALKIKAAAADYQMQATATKVETTKAPYLSPQEFTGDDQKTAREIQDKDAQLKEIRDLSEIATSKGDIGPLVGKYQKVLASLGVAGANSAELQRALQQRMTDNSFSSRYSPDIAKVLTKEGMDIGQKPEQYFAELNGLDQQNVDANARLWASKRGQRQMTPLPLRSPLKPTVQYDKDAPPPSQTVPKTKKH